MFPNKNSVGSAESSDDDIEPLELPDELHLSVYPAMRQPVRTTFNNQTTRDFVRTIGEGCVSDTQNRRPFSTPLSSAVVAPVAPASELASSAEEPTKLVRKKSASADMRTEIASNSGEAIAKSTVVVTAAAATAAAATAAAVTVAAPLTTAIAAASHLAASEGQDIAMLMSSDDHNHDDDDNDNDDNEDSGDDIGNTRASGSSP